MKTLIFLLFIGLTGFKKDTGCLKSDILILIDMSGSVIGRENTIHEAVYSFINKFELSEDGLRIGAYKFNNEIKVLYSLGDDKQALIRGINTIRSTTADGSTHLFEALMGAMGEFNNKGRQEVGVHRIVVVLSDGAPDNPIATLAAGEQLKRMYNAKIYGILIKSTLTNEPFMQQLSSKGCYLEVDYNSLIEEVQKLDICS